MRLSPLIPYQLKDPSLRSSLSEEGFVHLPSLTYEEEWSDCFDCPRVHHGNVERQIRNTLSRLNERTGWSSAVTKYRASAVCEHKSSNASDAGSLHRDIAISDPETASTPPVFTLVLYLDETDLLLVPGSHRRLRYPLLESLSLSPHKVHVRPGDGVLFHATLLHAGVFRRGDKRRDETDETKGRNVRRVVQCFDLFPSSSLEAKWSPSLLHLLSPKGEKEEAADVTSGIISACASLPVTKPLIDLFQQSRCASGYRQLDGVPLPDGVGIISMEAYRKRLPLSKVESFQYGNVYVPFPGSRIRPTSDEENDRLRSAFYSANREPFVPFFLVCVVLFSILSSIVRTRFLSP